MNGNYKLSVSFCFVSEHEGAHTSTFAVGQVVNERDMPEFQCKLTLFERIFDDML
jgi:hypothetical protein